MSRTAAAPRERWPPAAPHADLPAGEVRVWRVPVEGSHEGEVAILSAPERERAEAMRNPPSRDAFVTGRAALRRILAPLVGVGPGSVAISTEARGKPLVGGGPAFNVAHAGGLVLIALRASGRIGVDLERRDRRVDWEPIARRFLSEHERRSLEAIEPARRRHAFLACWTRKEAFVKALGSGIATGLERFDVTVDPDLPARLAGVRLPDVRPGDWSLLDLDAGSDHLAALAADSPRIAPRRFTLAPPCERDEDGGRRRKLGISRRR